MKAIIFTNFKATTNYGAILQAYALNKIVREFGFDCYTLSLVPGGTNHDKIKKIKIVLKESSVGGMAQYIKIKINRLFIKKILARRKTIFEDFREKYIPHTRNYMRESISNTLEECDIAICGSDQIWRPTPDGRMDKIMWLDGINIGRKITYAASIGLETLTNEQLSYAKEALSYFDFISVREESAVALLQPLVKDKKIEQVLDPVFLQSREEWDLFSGNERIISNKYVLMYFIHPSKKAYDSAIRYAKKHNLTTVVIPFNSYFNCVDCITKAKKRTFNSPMQFLNLIKNAEMIFTDSFHGTAFSLIFNKSFYYFSFNYTTRVHSLLSCVSMKDRVVEKGCVLDFKEISAECWDDCNCILNKEIEKSINLLKANLLGYK